MQKEHQWEYIIDSVIREYRQRCTAWRTAGTNNERQALII